MMTTMMMMKLPLQAPAQKILRNATRSRWRDAWCSSSFRSSSHVVSRLLLGSPIVSMSRSSNLRFVSQEVDTLRQLTKRVLAIEGPLSPKAWNGAETAFDLWTCHPVTHEGVEWGWKLLDRLVDEERQHSNEKSRLTTGWLYRMVSALNDSDFTMDPEQVLAKLEGYAPILVVDEKTRSMLQAAAKEKHSSQVAKQPQQDEDAPVVESSTSADRPTESYRNDNVFIRLHNAPIGSMDASDWEEADSSQVAKQPQQDEDAPVVESSASTDRPTESRRNDNVFIRLHNAPIGSMDACDWEEAENALLAQADSQAFRLLDRLVEEDHNSQQRVTTEWLNRIVQVWCTIGLIDPTELLVRLNSYAPLPDSSTYDLIVSSIRQMSILDRPLGSMTLSEWAEAEVMLTLWTNETATRGSVSSAWKLLDRLVEEEKYAAKASSDYESQLKSAWLDQIVAAWCRCGLSLEESTQVLIKMNRYAPHLSPDPNTYQMIVAAVSKIRPFEESKVDKAVSLPKPLHEPKLDESKADEHGRKPHPRSHEQPTTFMFNKMIRDLANSKGQANPQKAEEILEEMWRLYKAGNKFVKPNTITYSTVISAWGRSSHPLRAEKAEGILEHMLALCDAGDATVRPDAITFVSVIAAWAHSRDQVAGERADALFKRMQEMYEAGNSDLKPNTLVYNALLTVWSKSRDPSAAERAQAILRQMQELHDAGDADVKPDTISFNKTIKACMYSRSGRREKADRVEALLELMQKQYAAGNVGVKPNTASFAAVLIAWSRCENAGERAEAILSQMEALYEAGDPDVKPDTFCYNAVLIANVRSSDENAAERSQRILDQMEKLHARGDPYVKPNAMSYNSVVITWERSHSKSAPMRAEAILRRLQDLRDAGDPDIRRIIPITLLRVISVWVDSHDENAAEHAVRHLEELKNLGKAGVKFFEYAYEKVARLLSKSMHTDDDKKIDMLRQTMRKLGTGLEGYAPNGKKDPSEHTPERDSAGPERSPEDCEGKNSSLGDDLDNEDKSRLSPNIASGYTQQNKETLLVVGETS